ncbi:hypothetical protein ACTFIY_002708 [Dictyostelium cf. discoideum]
MLPYPMIISLTHIVYVLDDDDIKEQVAKFVESIPSQLCDILAETNLEEEEIQVLRDFINNSFEDVIVDKLPDIPDQINNSRRGNIIHNIIIKKDQDVEPTKKKIYYSTDEHKRHVEEMFLKFIDLGIIATKNNVLNGFTVEVDQVCVIVCRLSKMVYIVPCHKTIDAEHTAQLLLNHVFRLHGYPRTILSDRDPRFLSYIWSRWAKTMDSKLKMTVAHRAQAYGQTERMNRKIIRILTKASTEYGENWTDIIPLIEFAMNSSMSNSTKMSPFQITRIPMSNIKKIVRDNILDAQINAQKYYNRGRGDVIFVVGEKVMAKRKFFQTNLSKDLISHKLESKNCGPFIHSQENHILNANLNTNPI